MRISAREQRAIRIVVDFGTEFGYGNLITHLQTAWARRLMECGLDERTARLATGRDGSGYPFGMQDDLIERGEWDETGARYRKQAVASGRARPSARKADAKPAPRRRSK